MKKFAILSMASLMTLSVAHAEQPTQYFAIGHKMMTLDAGAGDVDITGTQLTYGKRIHEKVVLEGNLVTFLDMDSDAGDLEVSSIDISGLFYPINNQFHVRLGMSEGEIELEGISVDESSELLGVGYSWLVGASSGVRVEYTTAEYDGLDVDGFTLSVATRF
ncbi:hypothetical protein N9Y14_05105 [Alphaproteobacteria bacterium]|nr:hypothetical protein [Alphaproteobacteria bacterium]MDA8623823.1 hypothetical protein [Alphaproteobacteria bacterium]MDA8624913.1 hypothetical protein [Alphaproteobacteria bacterium]MDA8643182.1 hypothetical protein [Alphaproteobacteria bacterium]MDA8666884.1 hypothetical protein [Alphaproteobacteria bacterium]